MVEEDDVYCAVDERSVCKKGIVPGCLWTDCMYIFCKICFRFYFTLCAC